MSSAFELGDFLAVIELANKIRQDLSTAPERLQGIISQITSLSILLQGSNPLIIHYNIPYDQKRDLRKIGESCLRVLEEFSTVSDKYMRLALKHAEPGGLGLSKRAQGEFESMRKKIHDLEEQMTSNFVELVTLIDKIKQNNIPVLSIDGEEPIQDIEAFVYRSEERRLQEVKKKNGDILRPMNDFMLYRKAYQDKAKKIIKASWKDETKEIKDKFAKYAQIEKRHHIQAFLHTPFRSLALTRPELLQQKQQEAKSASRSTVSLAAPLAPISSKPFSVVEQKSHSVVELPDDLTTETCAQLKARIPLFREKSDEEIRTFVSMRGETAKQLQRLQQKLQQGALKDGDDSDDTDDIGESEQLYCYCNGPSHGEMVACDMPGCEKEWFHLECVGLLKPPSTKTKWFCPTCKPRRAGLESVSLSNIKSADGPTGGAFEVEAEIAKFVVQEDEYKFRCKIEKCSKLFEDQQYWKKHVEKYHAVWLNHLKQDTTAFTDSGYASHVIDSNLLQPEEALQDSMTVYSLASLPDSEKNNYQVAFISSLLKDPRMRGLGADFFDNLKDLLPEMLRAFALSLGRGAKQDRDYNAMLFIMKYRTGISGVFEDQWREHERNIARNQSQGMSLVERVRHWQKQQEHNPPENPEAEIEEILVDELEPLRKEADELSMANRPFQLHDTVAPEIQPTNLDFVTNTPAYTWLISKLVNHARLSSPTLNTLENIRAIINRCFPGPRKMSRYTAQLQHSMTFNLMSEVIPFLHTYRFDDRQDIADILETFVAITSDGLNTQALTVLQYLRQTWPQTGEQILSLIVNINRDGHASTVLPEGSIYGRISGTNFVFEVVGNAEFIGEIGGQLAWLGAVIRPSPVRGCAYDCKAFITNIEDQASHPQKNSMIGHFPGKYSCKIEYSMSPTKSVSGDCWLGLFHYPVIAHGFPVLKRQRPVQGLEMSLGTMLTLCHAEHIGMFNERIIMKGFSSMFSLSERQSGISVWHFSGSANGSYISCSDMIDQAIYQNLGVHEVLQDRHFVGWCSEVRYGAGALDSQYDVQPSFLSRVLVGGLLFEKSLRRGYRPQAEAACVASAKDSPRLTGGQSYLERLKRLHSRPVVLWDVEDQRGWLTNGTSALLHLVLASMEEDDSGPFSANCLRKVDIRQYETNTENAAAYILKDEQNLKLPILSHGGEPVLFRERVEDLYFLLDLIIEHQINALLGNSPISGMLEGWDFADISNTTRDPLHPRFLPIEKCYSWRGLLNDTNAIVLFGNDFGEIFTPANLGLCRYWNTLPKLQFHLAASVKDLDQITRGYRGNNKVNPRRLTENTTWPIVRRTFAKCACFTASEPHSDLVQVLVPNSMFTAQPDLTASNHYLPPNGAVIFGEVKDFVWFRPTNCATAEARPLKRLRSSTSSEVNDSGLGDSISSVQPMDVTESTIMAEEYLVAIICALPKELLAIRCLFDQRYADPVFDKNDKNSYAFGRIGLHKIVAACLPAMYGTCSATRITSELRRSFPSVESCLVIGIGGGIPSEKNDIRLGDVVVSRPSGSNTGIVKYDFKKVMQGGRSELLRRLPQPPEHLLSVIRILESDPHQEVGPLQEHLQAIGDAHPQYRYPGADHDKLFAADHTHHPDLGECTNCEDHLVTRKPRKSAQPYIHYGLIASGDKVIKNAKTRDRISNKHNALCFEMEGAGVTAVLPSLIIRGICDYSDTHKNDDWQEYASAAAAAYAKLILKKMRA